MEPQAECILVLIGATPEGKKELLGFADGHAGKRPELEGTACRSKGAGSVDRAGSIAVGDGALGFWKALDEAFPRPVTNDAGAQDPEHPQQTARSQQPNAKRICAKFGMAETRKYAEAAMTIFAEKYGAKYEKAAECLNKDRGALLDLLDFPAEHWTHLRTSDEIDKQFLRQRAIYGERERPRGEARRVGCKRRQASYSFLAGLRRSRAWPFAWPFGGRGRQASTKCW